MKSYDYVIYGTVVVDDGIDEETLENDLRECVGFPDCAETIEIDSVSLEEEEAEFDI